MPSSGTYAGTPTADDILTEAWERCGKNTAEITGEVARSARRSLDSLAIEWMNKGLNLWQVDQQSFATVIGTASYTLAAATVEPLDVHLTIAGFERTLAPIGRSDYAAIPDKATRGTPTQYWCNRVVGSPVLFVYPTPDAVLTVSYWRLRQNQQTGALGNSIDAPREWTDALQAGLAHRLATKYAPDRVPMLQAQAMAALALAAGENRQRVNLRLLPSRMMP